MFIKTVEIENFKSFLTHQTITAGEKNLIIGKNGSGKSNLLSALSTIFLFNEEKIPQNNSNDNPTIISVEIDNRERRFLFPHSFSIKMIHKSSPEFFINDKPISKEEYKGMLENAGFTQECFILQGKVNDVAMMSPRQRFEMLCKVAGVDKYEESKSIAMKFLNEENEDRIESLIERIEMKMKITDEYKKKAEEYDELNKRKTEAEFELMNYELKELNEEIDKIIVEENGKSIENDEGIVEYETKACRDEIIRLNRDISNCEEFLKKFEPDVVEQIKSKFNGDNPYKVKANALSITKNEIEQKLNRMQREESDLFVELKALKYFDAMGSHKEDIEYLQKQLNTKKLEVENYRNTSLDKQEHLKLVSERKSLWNKQKQAKDELKTLKEKEKELENKILYLGKLSLNVYETLKSKDGVLGTVYEIFEVPEKYLDAYEAVCRNSLFWIVVTDDQKATNLINEINERATFVALNRVNIPSKSKSECKLMKLSDQVKSDSKFENLLSMICKDFYICEDLQNALAISEKFNVNVVTLDGDIFNRNGSITGGYEGSNQVLRELKGCKKLIHDLENKNNEMTVRINDISEKIKFEELILEDDSRVLENLKGFCKYLEMKLEFMKKKKISLPEISDIESKYNSLILTLPKIKLELDSIDSQLSKVTEKMDKIDEIRKKLELNEKLASEIEKLKQKEQNLIDSLYVKKANGNLEQSFNLQRKHLLIDKRTQLLAKIGTNDFRSIYLKHSKDELMSELKDINKKLKNYYGFTKNDISDDQRMELKQRLLELKESKGKILSFMNLLDTKKDQTFNLSYSMISDNFSYFFKKFTGLTGSLVLKNDTIDILIDSKISDIQSLSGGQKTVVALSLIFAVQKNDPSPFYIFDEIDANLDMDHCNKLSEIITHSNSQYFITTFKSEMINSADKYFGVALMDNNSYVAEISKELAHETIIPAAIGE